MTTMMYGIPHIGTDRHTNTRAGTAGTGIIRGNIGRIAITVIMATGIAAAAERQYRMEHLTVKEDMRKCPMHKHHMVRHMVVLMDKLPTVGEDAASTPAGKFTRGL